MPAAAFQAARFQPGLAAHNLWRPGRAQKLCGIELELAMPAITPAFPDHGSASIDGINPPVSRSTFHFAFSDAYCAS